MSFDDALRHILKAMPIQTNPTTKKAPKETVTRPMVAPLVSARFGQRLRAFGWDYLIVVGYGTVLFAIAFTIYTVTGRLLAPTSAIGLDAFAFSILVLPVISYFAVCEASTTGQTIGKGRRDTGHSDRQ